MQTFQKKYRLKKQYIAILFAALALLSWRFDAVSTTRASISREFSHIPFALAKDDRVAGPLSMFLKADSLQGDAQDQRHKGEIEIDSYAWQMKRSMGANKPSMENFVVTMPSGKALPRLFLNAAGGLRLQKVVLAATTPGASGDFMKWTLTDAAIVSIKTVGNIHGDGLSDQVEFAFGKIEVEFVPSDGSAVQKAGWDQRTGKSVGY